MYDGFDLWGSQRNLQCLFDCDGQHLKINNFEELRTSEDEPSNSINSVYHHDNASANTDICFDKNNNSIENTTLYFNEEECIVDSSIKQNYVSIMENIVQEGKQNYVSIMENVIHEGKRQTITDTTEDQQSFLQEGTHNNKNNYFVVYDLEETNKVIDSSEENTSVNILLPFSSTNQKQRKSDKCFTCDICGRLLASQYNLKKHISTVHNVLTPFECDTCGRTFKRKGDLKTHCIIHSDEKPFVCDICERSFKRNGDLKEHTLTHSDGKPHLCYICGNRFTQYSTLRTHFFTHSGEHRFSCDICGKLFSVKTNLTAHLLTHTKEQPFSCELCGKKFSLKGNLKRHKVIHGEDS